MTWTLMAELAELTQSSSAESGLQAVGVLDRDESLRELIVYQDWTRAGAEMYTYVFGVIGGSGTTRKLILKAFVPAPGTVGVREGLTELLRRRATLAQFGVAVPRLFGSSGGTICEEFIPYGLWDRLPSLSTDPVRATDVLQSLFKIAFVIDMLQFAPIDPFTDLRTDDRYVYVIDFGQDLGPEGIGKSNYSITEELRERLHGLGLFAGEFILDAERRGRSSLGPGSTGTN